VTGNEQQMHWKQQGVADIDRAPLQYNKRIEPHPHDYINAQMPTLFGSRIHT
jgi:hypothetical protein